MADAPSPAHPLGESRTSLPALQGFILYLQGKKQVLEALMPLQQNMTYMTFVIFHSVRNRVVFHLIQLAASGNVSNSGGTHDETDA
jgi:hypothetical protein